MLCIPPASNLRHLFWKKNTTGEENPASVNPLFFIYSLYLSGLGSAVDVSWCVLFPYSGDASGDGGPFPPSPIPILKLPEYREGLSWELFPRCSIHRFLKTHLHPSPGFSYFCKFTEPVFWGKRGRPQVGSALIHSMSVTKTGPLLFA